MEFTKVLRRIEKNKKGTFVPMVWERPVKVKKAFQNEILTKRSSGLVRLGIDYDHMQAVQVKRTTGELPSQNAGLQWGQWEMFPYIIEHKGNKYLRCSPVPKTRIKTEYFLNGRNVEYAEIENMLLASEKTSTESLDTFSINVNHILAL